MKPILPGGRGPAVEDVQRRLLILGHDLGPTGVDGVFFGRTRDAVMGFQRKHELSEDGVVGLETWSALVDATFTFGDRMLYLRLPHFHGHDVRVLQEALNALGFSCGVADSIFGTFTERAVREFQRNSGLPADGIVGPDTVRTINNLRHVWEGKGHLPPVSSAAQGARLSEVLASTPVILRSTGRISTEVAERVINLAHATDPSARVSAGDSSEVCADVMLELREAPAGEGAPVVTLGIGDDPETLHLRLRTALEARGDKRQPVAIELPAGSAGEAEAQRYAILLLDALCAALS